MDKTDPALDPAHRSREFDRIAAQRIGRGGAARGLLGGDDDRFERIECPGQPRSQAVGQQAEGGVTLGAVPASDACPARGLARVGAVACQRTSPVRVIRTPLKGCIAPRLGPNVSLAGVPRRVSKLHRPWPGGGLPVRANSSLAKGSRDYGGAAPEPSGDDMDASFGPGGVLRNVWTRHGKVQKHLPTPCPHSPPSRPPPHRFNSNDSSQRQPHRHRNLPGLFRHPRQSVDGIVRSNTVGVQRNKVTNNTQRRT